MVLLAPGRLSDPVKGGARAARSLRQVVARRKDFRLLLTMRRPWLRPYAEVSAGSMPMHCWLPMHAVMCVSCRHLARALRDRGSRGHGRGTSRGRKRRRRTGEHRDRW